MIKKGDMVQSDYGFTGIISYEFENWEDLKDRTHFGTIDVDEESRKMDKIEKLIKGDPKDKWLEMQEKPFTEEQLNERWFSVDCIDGGGIWSCESRLKVLTEIYN